MAESAPYHRQNVLGTELQACSVDPVTGFFRTGTCQTGAHDAGVHVVCAEMTADFLAFSKERGNDLSTPHPEMDFPGLQPGDRWCLCMSRWIEALEAGRAPKVVLAATQATALEFVEIDQLEAHAVE